MTQLPSSDASPSQARGRERMENVLEEAERMLIDGGYAALTMRKLAERCGIALGNLQYYFPSKSALVAALVDRICERHREAIGTWPGEDTPPEASFETLLRYILDDIRKPEGSVLYWELWALAAHDERTKNAMAELYGLETDLLAKAIARINPALRGSKVRQRAQTVFALLEGSGLMIGAGRPNAQKPEPLMDEIIASALAMAKRTG